MALATSTPGSALRRSTPSRTICSTPSAVTNRGPVSDIRIVSTLLGIEAGIDAAERQRDVRIKSADPMSRTSASATSMTTQHATRLVLAETRRPSGRRFP